MIKLRVDNMMMFVGIWIYKLVWFRLIVNRVMKNVLIRISSDKLVMISGIKVWM